MLSPFRITWFHWGWTPVTFFPPQFEMRVPFLASSGKESKCFHLTSREGTLNLKVERKYRCSATNPRDPDVPVHSRYT